MLTRAMSFLCPVLLAAFPALSLFTHNEPEVELSQLWWPLLLATAAAVAAFGLLLLLTRRADKAGVVASLLVVGFFYYGLLFDRGTTWLLVLWVAAVLVGSGVLLRTGRGLGRLALVIAVAAAVMAVPRAVTVVTYERGHPSIAATDPRLWPSALARPVIANGARPPDIYVIMPDDYVRSDVLKQYLHHDDTAFLRELQQRGFVLSPQDRSPYSYSELNMASMLNLDYVTNWPKLLGKDSQDFRLVKRVMEDNRAARLLAPLGYEYIHLDTDEVTFAGGNSAISPLAPPDSFMNLWLHSTVLRPIGGPLGFSDGASNRRFRESIRSEFAKLGAVRQDGKPKLVVFHTLLPHDPYLFGSHGEPVTFPATADHTGSEGVAYYARQLEYLQSQLLTAVDRIIARSATPPVIVLQADEGFEVDPELFGEAAAEQIRVKGLGALYLPGHQADATAVPPNTVNTLRYVLNSYLGTHYPMLASVSHLEGDSPYDFQEIEVR